VLALSDLAKYFKLPTILTTSFETGPNGPLVPELKSSSPTPLHCTPRQHQRLGQRRLRQAVKATGKKQLLIAGVVTEVCVAFPVCRHWRRASRYSSSPTPWHLQRTHPRPACAHGGCGAQLMTWFGVACELHRDWRNDIEGPHPVLQPYPGLPQTDDQLQQAGQIVFPGAARQPLINLQAKRQTVMNRPY
jgi:nicotinamidase-related amidase